MLQIVGRYSARVNTISPLLETDAPPSHPVPCVSAATACALAALAGAAVTGCGKRELKTGREGQGIKVAGVTYNVYITRQLNPHDAEDSAYTAGQLPHTKMGCPGEVSAAAAAATSR